MVLSPGGIRRTPRADDHNINFAFLLLPFDVHSERRPAPSLIGPVELMVRPEIGYSEALPAQPSLRSVIADPWGAPDFAILNTTHSP
jgi:hypothetical protein